MVRIRTTTSLWLRSRQLPTLYRSLAQDLRTRAREAYRRKRCALIRPRSLVYARLVELCRARGCSLDDTQDLVQEAYLRLFEYRRSARVRDADSILRRIVINLTINYYHRDRMTPLVPQSIEQLDRRGILIDPGPDLERTLVAERELDGVVSLLSAVSPRTCQIFIVQRGGYSYEEIAAAFAIKPRTVEGHMASAMLALQEMLAAEFRSESVRTELGSSVHVFR